MECLKDSLCMVHQNNKGKNFERDIARRLSAYFCAPFTRSAHSGAFVGGKNVKRKSGLSENQITAFSGDIIPPDNWKMAIECKAYKTFSFHRLLAGEKIAVLDGWLHQLVISSSANAVSMLVIKINNQGTWVMVRNDEKYILYNHVKYELDNSVWIFSEFDIFMKYNTCYLQDMAISL